MDDYIVWIIEMNGSNTKSDGKEDGRIGDSLL